jgi:hypothetical protein
LRELSVFFFGHWEQSVKIRDRIKELRRVKASELHRNPRNWRVHPAVQARALRALLTEIGYADALIARELPDGQLQLIDGHLRAETTPDEQVRRRGGARAVQAHGG